MKTFAEIAPLWDMIIKEWGWPDNLLDGSILLSSENSFKDTETLNLNSLPSCIVGEAHGFDGDYDCTTCHTFAMLFFSLANYDSGKRYWASNCKDYARSILDSHDLNFKSAKRAFVHHWNKVHED